MYSHVSCQKKAPSQSSKLYEHTTLKAKLKNQITKQILVNTMLYQTKIALSKNGIYFEDSRLHLILTC